MSLNALRIALKGISAYRSICKRPLMNEVSALLDALVAGQGEAAVEHYTEVFYLLSQADCSGLGQWLEKQLKHSEEAYPLLAERNGRDSVLEEAARRDVETFAALAELDCENLVEAMRNLLSAEYSVMLDALPRWASGARFDLEGLTEFYRVNGTGLFACYRAFRWENGVLFPIDHPDAPKEHELLGYERQRTAVIENTRAMMAGHAVNNVLLYGDSGTGKSAAVKALLAREEFADLRMIELQKDGLGDLPALIRLLRNRRQKFILFLDDLAFDQDDCTYSQLKTILEGGLEARPDNVAIYATSNRRNLVRQTFSDRAGDEVDAAETVQEKTALADRFGLRVAYLPLNKADFLKLVDGLAWLEGIGMDPEELHAQAIRWEAHHPGRTPRTARQFIAGLNT